MLEAGMYFARKYPWFPLNKHLVGKSFFFPGRGNLSKYLGKEPTIR
jgi:hypothetical protein